MKNKLSRRKALGTIITGAVLGTAFGSSAEAFEDQPRMRRALDHLRSALNELQNASNDKGGYRVTAVDHTRKAIDQVERGIAFDNRNRRR